MIICNRHKNGASRPYPECGETTVKVHPHELGAARHWPKFVLSYGGNVRWPHVESSHARESGRPSEVLSRGELSISRETRRLRRHFVLATRSTFRCACGKTNLLLRKPYELIVPPLIGFWNGYKPFGSSHATPTAESVFLRK